jgi:RNA polymerase sigma factor (sigma-70 family)
VAQLAVDQHRKQSRLVQTEQDADLDRLAQDAAANHEAFHGSGTILNPEESVANSIAGAEMQKALARSIGNLSGQDRLLVKLYYFDDLRLREAGAVLGVHEATASRRLTRIHNDLRKDVEQILINECGWTKAETDRCFAELAINLQTDVESILAADDRAENQSGVRG